MINKGQKVNEIRSCTLFSLSILLGASFTLQWKGIVNCELVTVITKCQRAKISGSVAVSDSFFALIGAHQRGTGVGLMTGENPRFKTLTTEVSANNTCGSCWLGTSQYFHHDMRGENGLRIKVNQSKGHTYTNPRPTHYLTHAHSHITRAVVARDRGFAHSGAHQHGITVRQWPGKLLVQDSFLQRRVL